MNLKEINAEIASITKQIQPLSSRLLELQQLKRAHRGRAWIEANGVRLEDVELSNRDDLPYFGHVSKFAEWLRKNSRKRFCEWNTVIYFTREIVIGKMDPDAPATMEHLEKYEQEHTGATQ